MANESYKHVTGMAELNALLNGLPREVRSVALSAAVTMAVKPLIASQKRFAGKSERTGALRASITAKVKNYKNTGVSVGVAGPNRNYYVGGEKLKRGGLITADAARPAHYAHLIEFGHYAVIPRKGTTLRKATARLSKKLWVPAVPFVRPALVISKTEMASAFDAGMTRGIERAVAKIKSTAGAK